MASAPCCLRISRSREPTRAKASSHAISSKVPSALRRTGRRRRSGSLWMSAIAMPLGQTYPCEWGSSSSGFTETISLLATSKSKPQPASHRWQLRRTTSDMMSLLASGNCQLSVGLLQREVVPSKKRKLDSARDFGREGDGWRELRNEHARVAATLEVRVVARYRGAAAGGEAVDDHAHHREVDGAGDDVDRRRTGAAFAQR